MNRPNKIISIHPKIMIDYIEQLEKYCDELEAKLASYIDAESAFKHKIEMCEAEVFAITKRNIHLEERCKALAQCVSVLEKALDNACERLGNTSIICPINNERYIESICFRCEKKCKEPWKEKILKEVQDE